MQTWAFSDWILSSGDLGAPSFTHQSDVTQKLTCTLIIHHTLKNLKTQQNTHKHTLAHVTHTHTHTHTHSLTYIHTHPNIHKHLHTHTYTHTHTHTHTHTCYPFVCIASCVPGPFTLLELPTGHWQRGFNKLNWTSLTQCDRSGPNRAPCCDACARRSSPSQREMPQEPARRQLQLPKSPSDANQILPCLSQWEQHAN